MSGIVRISEMPVVKGILKEAQTKIFELTGCEVDVVIGASEYSMAVNKDEAVKALVRQMVVDYFGIKWNVIAGESRKTKATMARHIYIYMLHREFGFSQTEAGEDVNRDHTSALNAIKKIDGFLAVGDKNETVENLKRLTKLATASVQELKEKLNQA